MTRWQSIIVSFVAFALAATAGAGQASSRIAVRLPPKPAWRVAASLMNDPDLSKRSIAARKLDCLPLPIKEVSLTDARTKAWAEQLARRLQAAVKDIDVLWFAGRVSPDVSYAVFTQRSDPDDLQLALVREEDGALIYKRNLTMYVSRDAGWLGATRVGAFSFTISKVQGVYGLVIAGATGIPFKYGISAAGGWMVLVVSRGAVASERTLGETCYADINVYNDTNSLRSSRAYVVDADGDGYRDLLLWKRMFVSAGSSGNGENGEGCMTLKSEAVQLARFNPDTLDFELQSSAPARYALHDDLWYPATWGYVAGQDDIQKPWAGCDDSDRVGFERSEFVTTYLCGKDRARFPDDESFVPSKQKGKNEPPGK